MSAKNVAFIHIPKNAGSSIISMLKDATRCCGHSTDVRQLSPNIAQIVVLRDPVERFCSALQYALDYWSSEPEVRRLIDLGLTDHNDMIDAFRDPQHQHHSAICDEILNRDHRIGKRLLRYKWTYTLQHEWVHRPKYVLLFEKLDRELPMLCKALGLEPPTEIAHSNASRRQKKTQLTVENKAFLKKLYAKDYALLAKYRQIPDNVRCTGILMHDKNGQPTHLKN